MRRLINFSCEGDRLAATLDDASGTTGLLIISGGNEIRIGAHRGMARLAGDVSAAGFPVFRFDRRGIGDSEGENGEFVSSASDINAAIEAFRESCPHLTRIVAFGNCDAASALMLHQPEGIDAAVLANIWTIEAADDLPNPAAIKARYRERLRDPKAWLGLVSGAVDLRKLIGGLVRISKPQKQSGLAAQIADGMHRFGGPLSILLCTRDGTAIAFADEWTKPAFDAVRNRPDLMIERLDSASHSFASDSDYATLKRSILAMLAANSPKGP